MRGELLAKAESSGPPGGPPAKESHPP
jgi:hypothetical protein